MSFTVKLYSFSKKENSTAVPAAAALVRELQALIKQPSGIMEPVMRFQIDTPPYPAAQNCNYAYIEEFQRYYFITDWTSEPGKIWTASMRVDPLASWKSYIGSQRFYVLRASAEKDGDIMDAMYPAKDTYTVQHVENSQGTRPAWWNLSTDNPQGWEAWSNAMLSGYYILGLLSVADNYDMTGGVNYIAMRPAQMFTFMNLIFQWNPVTPSDTVVGKTFDGIFAFLHPDLAERQAALQNLTDQEKSSAAYVAENPWTDYIKSVVWVPDANVGDEITTGLSLGPTYGIPVYYRPVYVKKPFRYYATFTLPKHPLASVRGSYLNCEPFTELYAILPKMGSVKLPADLYATYNTLHLTLDIDPITGEGLYRLQIQEQMGGGLSVLHEINRWYAQIGVQIQIAQANEIGGRAAALANIAGTVLGALSNPGSITQLPAAIAEYQKKREVNGQTIGQAGSWMGVADCSGSNNGTPKLFAIHYNVADDDNAQNGRPLCKVRTPASLGGYMMIQDADISAPATKQELEEIRGYMEGGFYYE